jgi:hypothetical protein
MVSPKKARTPASIHLNVENPPMPPSRSRTRRLLGEIGFESRAFRSREQPRVHRVALLEASAAPRR